MKNIERGLMNSLEHAEKHAKEGNLVLIGIYLRCAEEYASKLGIEIKNVEERNL